MTEQSDLMLTRDKDVTIIQFREPTVLDVYHIDKISRELYALVEDEANRRLVMDFSQIKMLSSQTLSVLLKLRQNVQEVGGEIVISGINPGLYRVFKITNLQSVFEFFEDIDSAVASLASNDS